MCVGYLQSCASVFMYVWCVVVDLGRWHVFLDRWQVSVWAAAPGERKVWWKEDKTWVAEVLVLCRLHCRLTSNVNCMCNFGQVPLPL